MELTNVYELWDRFEKSNVSEMKLDFQGLHLELKKNTAASVVQTEDEGTILSVPVTEKRESASTTKQVTTSTEDMVVTAPLVGVFYCAPSPDEEPFVEVGQHVSKGDVVGIIEAMKVMNEITATKSGVVSEVFVEDADMVEYGQPILAIK